MDHTMLVVQMEVLVYKKIGKVPEAFDGSRKKVIGKK